MGDVLVADRTYPGFLRLGGEALDPGVVGIVSGRPGVVTGSRIATVSEAMPELARDFEAARAAGDAVEESARVRRSSKCS